jgi:hypothetical protein
LGLALLGLTLLITLLAAHLDRDVQCDSAPTIALVTEIAAAQPYVLASIINEQPDDVYRDALMSSAESMSKTATYRLTSLSDGNKLSTRGGLICKGRLVVTSERYGEIDGQIKYVIDQAENGQLVAAII